MATMQENLVPIAILSVLIFGENDDELLNQLQELGVLRLTGNLSHVFYQNFITCFFQKPRHII